MIDQTPSVQSVELLPCPFCGTTAHVVAFPRQHEGRMAAKIECFTDFCYAVVWADTPSQAITAWNRRAAPAPSSLAGGEVERAIRFTMLDGSRQTRLKDMVGDVLTASEIARVIERLAALSPEAPARDGEWFTTDVVEVEYHDGNGETHMSPWEVDWGNVARWRPQPDADPIPKDTASSTEEDDDDASTYAPSIAGLSDYLWNQALEAESVEGRCVLEMWREAVDILTPRHEAPASHAFEASHSIQREGGCKVCGHDEASHEAPAEGAGALDEDGDFPWPDTALSNALRKHFSELHGLTNEDASEEVHGVLDVIKALRARSSAPEAREGEAVAWVATDSDGNEHSTLRRNTMEDWLRVGRKVTPLYTHPAAPSADKLRSIIYAATDAVLPPACDTTGNGTQTRAAMQVEIADGVIAALKAEGC